jgi:hypothetical protein
MSQSKHVSSRSTASRAFALVSLALLPFACGQTDDNESGATAGTATTAGSAGAAGSSAGTASGGTGGSRAGASSGGSDPMTDAGAPPDSPGALPGTSETSKTIQCGGKDCKSIGTLLPNVFVDPCCDPEDACGTSTEVLSVIGASFAETCQARAQPGERTDACPSSAPRMLEVGGMSVTANGFAGCCRAETGTCGVIVNDIQAGLFAFAKPGLGCVDSAPFFDQAPGAPCGELGAGGAGGAPAGGAPSSGGAADGGVGGAP